MHQNQFAARLHRKVVEAVQLPPVHEPDLAEPTGTTEVKIPNRSFTHVKSLKPSFKYGVRRGGPDQDQYVRFALKQYNLSLYEEIAGGTRKPGGDAALYDELRNFDGPDIKKLEDIPNQEVRSHILRAIRDAEKAFHLEQKPKRLSMQESVDELKPNTAAGWPWIGKKKALVMPEIAQMAEEIHNLVKPYCTDMEVRMPVEEFRLPWCMAATRGGMTKDKTRPKTRLVWMFPSAILALEARIASPLYKAYVKQCKPLLLGRSPSVYVQDWDADRDTTQWELIGLDISHFDSEVKSFLVKEAFRIAFNNVHAFSTETLEKIQKMGTVEERNDHFRWEVNKHKRIRQLLQYYFINTPIMMPDGYAFRKKRGVPSGSFFTQVIDSIINYVYIRFTEYMQGTIFAHDKLRVLGDDSIDRVLRGTYDLEKAASDLEQHLKVTLSFKKSILASELKDLKVLGFEYEGGR